MNALCLPPALRFNQPVVPAAIASLARALDTTDAASRVEVLARLGGFERLRDFGVPEEDLAVLAADVADRAGARANPRPAAAHEVEQLLLSIW
jgi:alcohol dehydrogenase class IV